MSIDEKKKLKKYLGIAAAILLIIPIIIDRFLTYKVYMLWEWMIKDSVMTDGEWFSFLGSYLGVAGTVMIGMIAFWQTHIINQRNEELSNLQKQLSVVHMKMTNFQIHPVIHIKGIELHVEGNSKNFFSNMEKLKNYYFSFYGKKQDDSDVSAIETAYIVIIIEFEDKGIIPADCCEIVNFKWEIADHVYKIMLDCDKKKIHVDDKVCILIDSNDIIENKEQFYDDLDFHKNYQHNIRAGYDISFVELNLKFINQKDYDQNYNLVFWIQSGSQELEVRSFYLDREEKNERGTK